MKKQPKPYWKDVLRELQGGQDRQIIVLDVVADQSGQRGRRLWPQWFVVLVCLLGIIAQVYLRFFKR